MLKKGMKKTKMATTPSTTVNNANVEKALIENFIILQKVLTNLSIKFDGLSTKITKLLDLFEMSAKALSEKDFKMGGTGDLSEKMDRLLDENKTLAQGISLLHEGGETEHHEPEPQEEHHKPEPQEEYHEPEHTEPNKKKLVKPEKEKEEFSTKNVYPQGIKDYEKSN